MIMAFIIMNSLVVYGLFFAKDTRKVPAVLVAQNIPLPIPTVELKLNPTTIPAETSGEIDWTATGYPTDCKASGAWSGTKTMYGSESTGRIAKSGNYVFTLACSNAAGTGEQSVTLTVGNAVPPANNTANKVTPTTSTAVYCGGATNAACYGPREVAAHGNPGNCWGWNLNQVYNISGFDAAYHKPTTGISSIEVGGVCGKNLGPALSGGVSAGGQTKNHLNSTKSNTNSNMAPYFVGNFDPNKP